MLRRSILAGIGALLAAPAIIRTPGLLMPVKSVLAGPIVDQFIRPGVSSLHEGYVRGDILMMGNKVFVVTATTSGFPAPADMQEIFSA